MNIEISTPNVCAVYTEEDRLGRGVAGSPLNYVCADMKAEGIDTLYLLTDHTSFYERYGWEFLCMVQGDGEPARNTFTKAKILLCNGAEIEDILEHIPVFHKQEKEEKLLSFYSDFWLNYYYYLKSCPIEGYMKMRTIAEIIYSLYRIILQENKIFSRLQLMYRLRI